MSADQMIDRIRKLLNMAAGAKAINNLHEAEAFAAKAQELLMKHKLSMSDVEASRQKDDDPMDAENLDPGAHGIKPRKTRMAWQEKLASAVAYANFCGVAVHAGSNRMTFIGRRSDRQIAMYVYFVLASSAERLVKIEYRKLKKAVGGAGPETHGFNSSFLMGFATAIMQRLREERERMEAQLRTSTGTALVRLDTARAEVRDYMKQQGTRTVAFGRAPRNINDQAFASGVKHGRSINMPSRGVTDNKPNAQLPK